VDLDCVAPEVCGGVLDRAGPDEAEITVTGLDGISGDEICRYVLHEEPWAVNTQILSAKSIHERRSPGDDLRTEDVAIMIVGPDGGVLLRDLVAEKQGRRRADLARRHTGSGHLLARGNATSQMRSSSLLASGSAR
jgi:hypothetical protein